MKRSKQAGKYILSDFVSASVAWLLFNILRYEILFIINEGTDSLLDYLQYPGVLTGQIVIPFFWLVLYYFQDITTSRLESLASPNFFRHSLLC